jgi:hypothetical protein
MSCTLSRSTPTAMAAKSLPTVKTLARMCFGLSEALDWEAESHLKGTREWISW